MKRFFFRFVWGVLLALNCFPWFFFYSHAQQEGGTSLDPSTTPGPFLEGNVDDGTVPMEREPKPRNSAQGSNPLPTTTASLVNVYAQANLNMLPTSSPTESGGYGEPMNVLDIPRQIFPVNQTVLQTEGAGTLGYLDAVSTAFLSPGSMASAANILLATPTVRGMQALPFFNGMQMSMSLRGNWNLPFNYNMVDSVDVIEGIPNAVFGELQPNGGAVNYITKQPYFNRFRGNVWDTTGMYQNYLWGVDIGGPIDKEKKVAYRFSYLGMENGSYYQYQYNNQQNFYLAVSAHPTDNYSVDFYSDFGTYAWNMDFMNRPTNELINNDLYQTGAQPPAQVGVYPLAPFNTYAGPLVPISLRSTITNPEGGGYGMNGMLQLVQNVVIDDDLRIRNNTFAFYIRSSYLELSQGGDVYIPGDYQVFNRTEVLATLHPEEALFEQLIDAGVEIGFQNNLDYEAFGPVGTNAWSIVNPDNPALANPYLFNGRLSKAFAKDIQNPHAYDGGYWPIPSGPAGYYFQPLNGYAGTDDSQFWEMAPFYQHNIHFTDQLSLLVGARANTLFITAQTPPGTPALLATGYNAAELMPMVNVSPVYKPFPWMTVYFDYNWGYTSAIGQGGGYPGFYYGANFRLVNQLIEGGLKFSLLQDKLYITTAGFSQDLYIFNVDMPPTPSFIEGFELAATYQPNKNFWARVQYILANGTMDFLTSPYQQQTYSTSTALAQRLPLDTPGHLPPGKYAFVGWPDQTLSAMVTYQTNGGLGVTLSALVMSNQYLDYTYDLVIPTEYVINARLFYSTPRWNFSINIYNLTNNRHLWFPFGPGTSYGEMADATEIVAGLPFWVQGTVAYRF